MTRLVSAGSLLRRLEGRKVLIDTNVIIYLVEDVPGYGNLAQHVFHSLEAGGFEGVVSAITLGELMMGPLRAGRSDVARNLRDWLGAFPNLECRPVDERVLAHLGKDPSVRWERLRATDALIVAAGLAAGAELFLSNDLAWRNALSPEVLVALER